MKQARNNNVLLLAGLALFSVSAISFSAMAQNSTPSAALAASDVQKLETGYRTSKIIGSNVVNNTNETIGKIDDIMVSPDDNKSAYVIISVGGWLGMDTHLVALPYDNLQISSNKVVLPDATKAGLKALPEFKYNKT